MLTPIIEEALRTTFQRWIAATDQRICDLALEYDLDKAISEKIEYVGYISEAISQDRIAAARTERGLTAGAKWIVCSAGGGALGEQVIQKVSKAVGELDKVFVDVVQGPLSALPWPSSLMSTIESGRLRLHRETKNLPLMHAAADIVVCTGGYNSLTETMEGGAEIIAVPVQLEPKDEQYLHATKLARHYPITVVGKLNHLERALDAALGASREKATIRESGILNFNGISNSRDVILSYVPRHRDNKA